MLRVRSHLHGLVDTLVDRTIKPYVDVKVSVAVDLSKLPPNVKSQLLLNLRRGWSSAMKGVAAQAYRILAAKYKFPVFIVGRGGELVLSIHTMPRAEIERLIAGFQAVWNLGKRPDATHLPYNQRAFYCNVRDGSTDEWKEIKVCKAPATNIHGVCALLNVKDIWEIVPKDRMLEATSAILRGERFEVLSD